jgi:hypothetical protein
MEHTTRTTIGDAVREIKDRAQTAAGRATSYVRDAADSADQQVARITGKPLGSWTADMREWVNSYPLQSTLLALGLGYVLGRTIRRG